MKEIWRNVKEIWRNMKEIWRKDPMFHQWGRGGNTQISGWPPPPSSRIILSKFLQVPISRGEGGDTRISDLPPEGSAKTWNMSKKGLSTHPRLGNISHFQLARPLMIFTNFMSLGQNAGWWLLTAGLWVRGIKSGVERNLQKVVKDVAMRPSLSSGY